MLQQRLPVIEDAGLEFDRLLGINGLLIRVEVLQWLGWVNLSSTPAVLSMPDPGP